MRRYRALPIAFVLAAAGMLAGCESFDPTDMFNQKKPLPGDRRAVFPEGVPGVPQGVPPELVQGYQPPAEPPPPEPSITRTMGKRNSFAICSAMMVFSLMVASADPPRTVKSSPQITTGRPSTVPRPNTQLAACRFLS